MASHASLGFNAVRLLIQTESPDGPIQQIQLCLHHEWQPTPGSVNVHLLGPESDSNALPATTSGQATVVPLDHVDDGSGRYMVIDRSDGSDEDAQDGRDSSHPCHEEPLSWSPSSSPSPTSYNPTNYIINAGLIRLYHDPYDDKSTSELGAPVPADLELDIGYNGSRLRRSVARVDGLLCLVFFVFGAVVASAVFYYIHADVDREVLIDSGNRTININLNYMSIQRAFLLGGEALWENPIDYGHLFLSRDPAPSANLHPHQPPFLFNSADHFVPEQYFFQDMLTILSHTRSEIATLTEMQLPKTAGSGPRHDFDDFMDAAEWRLYELQRLYASLESDVAIAWAPRAAEASRHHLHRLEQAREAMQDDSASHLKLDHWGRRLVNRLLGSWASDSRENITLKELQFVFTRPPFPGVFGRLVVGDDAPPEHLMTQLAKQLSTTLLDIHRITERMESTTNATPCHHPAIPDATNLDATIGGSADGPTFAAARVACAARFLREIALPRLRLLNERVQASRRLLRNVFLAQHELILFLQEALDEHQGPRQRRGVFPPVEDMAAHAAVALRWIAWEAHAVDAVFRERQAPFLAALRGAVRGSNTGRLPSELIYSRWGLGDGRSDPYGTQRIVWRDWASIKREVEETRENKTETRKKLRWWRLWLWDE